MHVGTNSNTLSFSSLQLYDAGQYTCQVTIVSLYLYGEVNAATRSQNVTLERELSACCRFTSYFTTDIFLTVPAPAFVTVTSNKPNPIQPVGSDVTLTCTVELSPAVDVPVTVNTVWTGPDEFMTANTAQPVMGSTTTYTSTAMVSSFGRDQSGNYTCTATVSSTAQFINDSELRSGIARVSVGEIWQSIQSEWLIVA